MYQFNPRNTKAARSAKSKPQIIIKNAEESDDDSVCLADGDNCRITKENNHIYFHSEVDRDAIFEMITLIRKAEIENIVLAHNLCTDPIPIYLHINSFGGSVFDALTAIDVIQACKVPVHTVIEGASASAGTLISVVGAKRYIRPNAHMLIHQLSAGSWGKMSELEDEHENNALLMNKILDIYKKHANIPKKQLSEVLKHDLWWESDKCMKYGLVDELWERT
jgi:ATP-dependent Clp endopeptidase proteolytic subunit ClpP